MLIKNAAVTDAQGTKTADILIKKGLIAKVEPNITADGEEIIDATNLAALPAFIDLHTHFRTPGFEYKEDIESGSKAAARGGYTFVNCMANTKPVCSSAAIAQSVMDEAKRVNLCGVNQVVSITKDFDGKTVSHLTALPKNIRVISEDGKGVQSNYVMWQAMKIAAEKNLIVMSHAEDMDISPYDYRLAENIETARNIFLAEYTGARLHMCHVSTKEALQSVLDAKKRGVKVTSEVTPHHIWFADTPYRVNPPIRTAADVEYLINAMKNGEVEAIATDHAPHSPEDKANGAPGMVGLETAFSICYTKLCVQNKMPLETLSKMMSRGGAEVLGLNKGLIKEGFDGDITLVDLNESYTVNPDDFAGKSHNTPYAGETLTGKVKMTIKAGKLTYMEEKQC
ncbi:MAG: dihydroorotase [Clostridia bacterium]|nr:dihydroorotase [Clostridia bacterium]NLS84268.1 dihydroorotase [Oscillospiraceae bacterium]